MLYDHNPFLLEIYTGFPADVILFNIDKHSNVCKLYAIITVKVKALPDLPDLPEQA